MGAMPEEIQLIKLAMTNIQEIKVGQNVFYKGKLGVRTVILSLSGVGTVNAAMTTTLLITYFRVGAVVFSGVSGALSPHLQLGDIIIPNDFIQHNVDETALGVEIGRIHSEDIWQFPADENLCVLSLTHANKISIPQRISQGRIASGDIFVSSYQEKIKIANTFDAEAVDMESAVVAKVAYKFGIPLVIIRGISDTLNGNHEEFEASFEEIAKKPARILIDVVKDPQFPY